jgi:hypothetical protein
MSLMNVKIWAGVLALGSVVSCVTADEDELYNEDPPDAVQTIEAPSEPTPTPIPQPAGVPEAIKPPVDPVTQGAVLPLPVDTKQFTVHIFLRDYKPAYQKFENLVQEYRAYFVTITTPSENDEAGKAPLRLRVKENYEKAHWAFLHGCNELIEYMNADAKGVLVSDREENFVARMKTLAFLAKELGESSRDAKYQKFVRELYVRLSEAHFGRKLAPLKTEEN